MHIDVGKNSRAWFEDEVDNFLEAKAAERDAKVAGRAAKADSVTTDSDREAQPRDEVQGARSRGRADAEI
jgi:hypothetical protein